MIRKLPPCVVRQVSAGLPAISFAKPTVCSGRRGLIGRPAGFGVNRSSGRELRREVDRRQLAGSFQREAQIRRRKPAVQADRGRSRPLRPKCNHDRLQVAGCRRSANGILWLPQRRKMRVIDRYASCNPRPWHHFWRRTPHATAAALRNDHDLRHSLRRSAPTSEHQIPHAVAESQAACLELGQGAEFGARRESVGRVLEQRLGGQHQ